jgi:hypothetical protein
MWNNMAAVRDLRLAFGVTTATNESLGVSVCKAVQGRTEGAVRRAKYDWGVLCVCNNCGLGNSCRVTQLGPLQLKLDAGPPNIPARLTNGTCEAEWSPPPPPKAYRM